LENRYSKKINFDSINIYNFALLGSFAISKYRKDKKVVFTFV